MTSHYNSFIALQNFFRTSPFPEDITQLTETQVDEIKNIIESKLSPENLYCDGEISLSQAQQKFNNYLNVCQEITLNSPFEIYFKQLSY